MVFPLTTTWGDDGTIVFARGGRGLYRVPETGGEPTVLLESASVRNPKLLPGGQAVMFTDPSSTSTRLLDLRTDSVIELIDGGIDAMYVETGHLLYVDLAGSLWAVAFDLGMGALVGDPVPVLDGIRISRTQWARYSVSRSGTLVYELGRGGTGRTEAQLVVVDLEGNEEVLVLAPRRMSDPRWSPDGQSVVYQSSSEGDNGSNIYTYDVILGTTPRQLTYEGTSFLPVFSHDGTRVVFAHGGEGADGLDLFVKTLGDDQPAKSLITLAGNQVPTQWPADTLIVFGSTGGGQGSTDLWMLDLSVADSARAQVYLPSEADLADIVVSRDGTLAAYGSDETGIDEVYVRGFPEPGEPTVASQGGGVSPFWSPDGNTVYYWTNGEAPSNGDPAPDVLMAARLGRDPTLVLSRDTVFTSQYALSLGSDLHPEGNSLVVLKRLVVAGSDTGAAEAARSILVTNWFTELLERMGSN